MPDNTPFKKAREVPAGWVHFGPEPGQEELKTPVDPEEPFPEEAEPPFGSNHHPESEFHHHD